MQIVNALRNGAKLLIDSNIESASIDARLLLKYALNLSEEGLNRDYYHDIDDDLYEIYLSLIKRRTTHEPIAYIIESKEFYGRNFVVNQDVLIPRPDSETLIEAVLKKFPKKDSQVNILDIGTGSGCLINSLLLEYPHSKGLATDISDAALRVAMQNAKLLGTENRVTFKKSDIFEVIEKEYFDIIISNPPYIAKSEVEYMSKSTSFEPEIALFAQNHGLVIYERIASNVANYMHEDSIIFLEIGFRQEKDVVKIFERNNLRIDDLINDLSGITRCVVIKKC